MIKFDDPFTGAECDFAGNRHCSFLGAIFQAFGSVAGAGIAGSSANKAARFQADAADRATDLQREIFDINRTDFAPFREVGTGAIRELGRIFLGVDPSAATARSTQIQSLEDQLKAQSAELDQLTALPLGGFRSDRDNKRSDRDNKVFDPKRAQIANLQGSIARLEGDLNTARNAPVEEITDENRLSSFFKSPDFTFRQQEGEKAINRAAAARGTFFSGQTGKALTQFGGDLASGEFNTFVNRLSTLAGIGQSATTSGTQANLQSGQQIGQSLLDAGTARASGAAGVANAFSSGINDVARGFGNAFSNSSQSNLNTIAQADVTNPALSGIF